MAMTADEAAAVAASALTTRNVPGVAATYKTWLNSKTTLASAVVALLQAHRTSKSPDRVIAAAAVRYAAIEHDPPTITSITPATGTTAGGTAVSIVGTNLLGATVVTIGGTTCTSIVVVDDTQITAVTPAKTAGAKDLVVTTPDGTVTAVGAYTYA